MDAPLSLQTTVMMAPQQISCQLGDESARRLAQSALGGGGVQRDVQEFLAESRRAKETQSKVATLLGGRYLEIGLRHDVSINPFAFDPTPEHLHFLHAFVRVLRLAAVVRRRRQSRRRPSRPKQPSPRAA